ncbi:MAG: cation:dicarboxylase symporter family transporter [Planctomycetales bacterium]|nr:cation:dicarboxylase symporter family transporter [Planctomycetales bacterium]
MWLIALLAVFLLAQAFPHWDQGSFFSDTSTDDVQEAAFLEVFIPTNVFDSLARNHVPAVVLISIWAGIVLSRTSNRKLLITQLEVVSNVLTKVSKSIAGLAPFGVFAIAASTAGTISFDEFGRLQAYFIIYTFGAATVGLVILPMFVVCFTPFNYRDVFRVAGEATIMAFATGKLIVVIPTLVQRTEELFANSDINDRKATPSVDILYPLAYPFPHVGKLLSMLFIPFAAWFLGSALSWSEYPGFLCAGVFSYFGGPLLAIPFLLDYMHLPHDMFQLFLLAGLWEGRIGDALGAIHLVVFTILATCTFTKQLRFSFVSFLRFSVVCAGSSGISLFALTLLTNRVVHNEYQRNSVLLSMQLLESPTEHAVYKTATPNPDPLRPDESLLERIRRRGKIRVGYNEDKLPFAFFNSRGDLVGYDVEMAHVLANDLNVAIEFVQFDRHTLAKQLADDDFDVVMSGLVGTLERSEDMSHTDPYMDVTLGLVVPDYDVRRFRSLETLRTIPGLRIGFIDLSRGFVQRLAEALPNAELEELPTIQEYFDGTTSVDALLVSAESGSAYSLLYPEYEVVLPMEPTVTLPLFYAVGNRDAEMREYMEHWVELKRRDGTMEESYAHWILGKTTSSAEPRWCVIRNVLR